ncbi:MAG: hypothetical protein D3917_00660 [Candidatus Electrothrix sp. AX5]|nr:hypothetical protein [Candidatus Electrothrix sp. AX5]
MVHPKRINMIDLLAVTSGWCLASREPIKIKKLGHKVVSLFQLDLKVIILRHILERYNESTEKIWIILKPQVSRFQAIFCIVVFFDHYYLCRTTKC